MLCFNNSSSFTYLHTLILHITLGNFRTNSTLRYRLTNRTRLMKHYRNANLLMTKSLAAKQRDKNVFGKFLKVISWQLANIIFLICNDNEFIQ